MVTRKCIICGKIFQARANTITCSIECRKINNRNVNNANHVTRYRGTVKAGKALKDCKSKCLDADIAKAKELNMSYGKYKAMQYLKQI